jgi:hypothetical protein
MLPLAILGLTDECIFSASELDVGDQPLISFNCVGSTDGHSWSESRKTSSLLEWTDTFSFITGLTGEHIFSHSVNGNAPV